MASSRPPIIQKAFLLGAGLGTRLRPITAKLPKPLVPVAGKPLAAHCFDHLATVGVEEIVINTHHASEEWKRVFPESKHKNQQLHFRHEPILLETGGGLKNVEDHFINGRSFLMYNGDILTDIPLASAIEEHHRRGNLATLLLRSSGGPLHVEIEEKTNRITDIRGLLGTGKSGRFLFTGIHVLEPDIFQHIEKVQIESIIGIYLRLIKAGMPIGGVVIDEGEWTDIGTLEEYERIQKLKH
jgi:mannose-1-phosphate guanylyltransferase